MTTVVSEKPAMMVAMAKFAMLHDCCSYQRGVPACVVHVADVVDVVDVRCVGASSSRSYVTVGVW